MKNNMTELVFILDRSGSMSGFEDDTIGGFNSMIEKQKEKDGFVFVSTVLFDNESEVLHDRVELREVKPFWDAKLAGRKGKELRAVTFMKGQASKEQMTWEVLRVDLRGNYYCLELGKRIA